MTAASRVMEMELVLDARMVEIGVTWRGMTAQDQVGRDRGL